MGRWLITNAPNSTVDLLPRPIIVVADREALPRVLRSLGVYYVEASLRFLNLDTVEGINDTYPENR
jgi:hypothetical protein